MDLLFDVFNEDIALSVQFRTKFKGLSGPKFDVLGL